MNPRGHLKFSNRGSIVLAKRMRAKYTSVLVTLQMFDHLIDLIDLVHLVWLVFFGLRVKKLVKAA